jgi:hypothetical protein
MPSSPSLLRTGGGRVTGFGPRRGSEADREPAGETVDRDAAAAMAHQFYADGQRSVTHGGYQAGHDLAFDVGYGARNDDARMFVRGVLEGHASGLDARRELLEATDAPQRAARAAEARARLEARQTELTEPEHEAQAG